MKEMLTMGKKNSGLIILVDDEDYVPMMKFHWRACKSWTSKTFYAYTTARKMGLIGEPMHRLIMGCVKGDGKEIDHVNGNGLDNRRSNLRICSKSQNHANQKHAQKNSKTGLKGVTWYENRWKYRAKIIVNKKTIHLGCFTDKIQAAKAYDQAALKYFGEFAALNFPIAEVA